jgi:hypothetical protein
MWGPRNYTRNPALPADQTAEWVEHSDPDASVIEYRTYVRCSEGLRSRKNRAAYLSYRPPRRNLDHRDCHTLPHISTPLVQHISRCSSCCLSRHTLPRTVE